MTQPQRQEKPKAIPEGSRPLVGEAAWTAHLDAVAKRNGDARSKAAERASTKDVADAARARRLKGD